MALTEAGRSFHDQARVFLQELRGLTPTPSLRPR